MPFSFTVRRFTSNSSGKIFFKKRLTFSENFDILISEKRKRGNAHGKDSYRTP